jgi:hypothetical protein
MQTRLKAFDPAGGRSCAAAVLPPRSAPSRSSNPALQVPAIIPEKFKPEISQNSPSSVLRQLWERQVQVAAGAVLSFAAVATLILPITALPAPAHATGLESVDLLPSLETIQTPEGYRTGAAVEASKLKAVDDAFENCKG